MRAIGAIADAEHARRFGDYLVTVGIANQVEGGSSGHCIWVEHDDHLERAHRELAEFMAHPEDPKYDTAETASRVRREQESRAVRLRRRFIDVRTRWHLAAGHGGSAVATLALIILCGVVAAASGLGSGEREQPLLAWLYFGNPPASAMDASGQPVLRPDQLNRESPDDPSAEESEDEPEAADGFGAGLSAAAWERIPELRSGQLWRLITPIFIHYGILHLIFNLFWLRDLGLAIEGRKGPAWLLTIVLVTAVLANVGQFAWSGSPHFGGMSGVVYGLFGYCWIKSRLQPYEQFQMGSQTILIMLVWLVLCMTGLVGSIANAAHVVGLLVGVAFAYGTYLAPKVRRALAGR